MSIEGKDAEEKRELLKKCAMTTLSSKLVGGRRILRADGRRRGDAPGPDLLDPRMIGIKKVVGGSMRESFLVDGAAFKKTFAYAGFEQQPKYFENPKVLALNLELELKARRTTPRSDSATRVSIKKSWTRSGTSYTTSPRSAWRLAQSSVPPRHRRPRTVPPTAGSSAGRVTEEDLLA